MLGLRFGRLVSALTAAAVVTIIIMVAAGRERQDDSGFPPNLEKALLQVIGDRSCLAPTDAERQFRVSLDRSGFSDWTISRERGVRSDGCVSAGVSTSDRRIVLIPVARLEVRQAMQRVTVELRRRCLGEDDAIEYIASVLRSMGEANPEIRSGAWIVIPEASAEAVQRHVDAGCFTYSGMTWTAAGQPVYLIGGHAAEQRTDRPAP